MSQPNPAKQPVHRTNGPKPPKPCSIAPGNERRMPSRQKGGKGHPKTISSARTPATTKRFTAVERGKERVLVKHTTRQDATEHEHERRIYYFPIRSTTLLRSPSQTAPPLGPVRPTSPKRPGQSTHGEDLKRNKRNEHTHAQAGAQESTPPHEDRKDKQRLHHSDSPRGKHTGKPGGSSLSSPPTPELPGSTRAHLTCLLVSSTPSRGSMEPSQKDLVGCITSHPVFRQITTLGSTGT